MISYENGQADPNIKDIGTVIYVCLVDEWTTPPTPNQNV